MRHWLANLAKMWEQGTAAVALLAILAVASAPWWHHHDCRAPAHACSHTHPHTATADGPAFNAHGHAHSHADVEDDIHDGTHAEHAHPQEHEPPTPAQRESGAPLPSDPPHDHDCAVCVAVLQTWAPGCAAAPVVAIFAESVNPRLAGWHAQPRTRCVFVGLARGPPSVTL